MTVQKYQKVVERSFDARDALTDGLLCFVILCVTAIIEISLPNNNSPTWLLVVIGIFFGLVLRQMILSFENYFKLRKVYWVKAK